MFLIYKSSGMYILFELFCQLRYCDLFFLDYKDRCNTCISWRQFELAAPPFSTFSSWIDATRHSLLAFINPSIVASLMCMPGQRRFAFSVFTCVLAPDPTRLNVWVAGCDLTMHLGKILAAVVSVTTLSLVTESARSYFSWCR